MNRGIKMTNLRQALLLGSGLLLSTVCGNMAFAQNIEGNGSDDARTDAPDDDIVVTAQFLSRRLQDTPLAITATRGEVLEARGQANVTDFAAQVPSLYIQSGGSNNGPSATISLRGIGQSDPTLALEPGVGLYIDDIYYSSVVGSNFDLLDLDRVEVLRGPQGTLAGRNSIGGAIKLYSRKPDGETSGLVKLHGGSFERAEVLASFNLPILADKLFARLSGTGKHSNGFVKRVDFGCAFPGSGIPSVSSTSDCVLGREGGEDTVALRGALRWLASDRVEVNVIGDYANTRGQLAPSILIYADRAGNGLPPLTLGSAALDSSFIPRDYRTSYATFSYNGLSLGLNNDRRVWGISGNITAKLSDRLSLTSLSAFREQRVEYSDDPDSSPFYLGLTNSTIKQEQFTQELRLQATVGSLADVTVGGFYFHSDGIQAGRTEFFPLSFLFADAATTKSYSAFAHAVLHVSPQFDLTGGVRYTHDKRTYAFARSDPDGGPAFLVGIIDGQTNAYNANRVDYRANASYRFNDQLMAYAQFSTGFKSGGANPRPVFPNQVVNSGPETLNAFEVGFKSDLLDRKVRLNVAAFHNDYKGIQISTATPYFNPRLPVQPDPFQPNFNPVGGTAPAFVIQNAGTGRTKGIEIEATITPAEGLTLEGSVSYLDFKYRKLIPQAIASGLRPEFKTPYTPKWKWSAGAQYRATLGEDVGTLTPRIDVAYQSEVFAYPVNSAINRLNARTLVNARLAYGSPDETWEVAASVTNLTDKAYLTSVFDIAAASGVATAGVGRPREWSLAITKRF